MTEEGLQLVRCASCKAEVVLPFQPLRSCPWCGVKPFQSQEEVAHHAIYPGELGNALADTLILAVAGGLIGFWAADTLLRIIPS